MLALVDRGPRPGYDTAPTPVKVRLLVGVHALASFEKSVRCQVSGKALAAGIAANQTDQEPAASALPLTYFSKGAEHRPADLQRMQPESLPKPCGRSRQTTWDAAD